MELRHSCLIAATHENSFTLGGATYRMQNATDLRHSVSQSQHMKRQLHCAEHATSGTQKAMELRHLCLIAAMHETWFTLCGVSDVPLQLQQILRLPRQMTLMTFCPHHTWNIQYKWPSWFVFITNETFSAISGATEVTHRHPQKLLLPRKMNLRIDLRQASNVRYNARSIRRHPPTSPNSAPRK